VQPQRLPFIAREVKLLPKEMNRTQNWMRRHDPEHLLRHSHSLGGGSPRGGGERNSMRSISMRSSENIADNMLDAGGHSSSEDGNGGQGLGKTNSGLGCALPPLYEIQWMESENCAAARSAVSDGMVSAAAPNYY
jgi:hypothetical protein